MSSEKEKVIAKLQEDGFVLTDMGTARTLLHECSQNEQDHDSFSARRIEHENFKGREVIYSAHAQINWSKIAIASIETFSKVEKVLINKKPDLVCLCFITQPHEQWSETPPLVILDIACKDGMPLGLSRTRYFLFSDYLEGLADTDFSRDEPDVFPVFSPMSRELAKIIVGRYAKSLANRFLSAIRRAPQW